MTHQRATDKLDFIKIKIFCSGKTSQENEKTIIDWENRVKDTPDKRTVIQNIQ